MQLETFDRQEWLGRRWDYQPGQHVAIYGPTGVGKSETGFALLERTPGIPWRALVMKPKDATASRWTRELGARETGHWPPPAKWPWQATPPGHTLWPRQSLTDYDADELLLYNEFSRCLTESYAKGDCIVFADEVAGLCDIATPKGKVPIRNRVTRILTRGRAMKCGLWGATQRPFSDQGTIGVPQHMHSEASHWIIGRDPDPRNRMRTAQISGADPREIGAHIDGLQLHPIPAEDGTINYVSELLHAMKGGPRGAYLCKVMPW